MNPGGVRSDILIQPGGGTVNFGQLFKVQPFGNTLVVKRMRGDQIKAVLEKQYVDLTRPRVLYPSQNLSYEVDLQKPAGQRVQNIRIRQQTIEMSQTFNVTVNSFMASGGDGFTEFNHAPVVSGGELDVDALSDYLIKNPGLTPPATNRIRQL
jgi:5'-nucleotidase